MDRTGYTEAKQARTRSVDNLQKVYTVVVSLAITESLRRLLTSLGDSGTPPDFAASVAVISLLITIVPFYHGANRYLDSTYVTGERRAKSEALLIDFVAIFLEALAFFVLAILIKNTALFFTILAILFLFDAAWVGLTQLTGSNDESQPSYVWWAIANIAACFLILVSIWSNLLNWRFWPTDLAKLIAVGVIAVIRTVIDYWTVWKFYYPASETEPYIMPIPLPARPPRRGKGRQH